MKRIERSEILPLGDYETIRPRFRARVIEEKKHRRVHVGPRVTALFENRDSVLLQIQEMLRTERITREGAIQHEIDTYNELIPPDGALSCTMLIEIDDKDERERFLVEAKGLENAVLPRDRRQGSHGQDDARPRARRPRLGGHLPHAPPRSRR